MTKFNTHYLTQSIKFIKDFDRHEFSVIALLISYGNLKNRTPLPYEHMKQSLKVSTRTLPKIIASLEKKGYLSTHKPAHYTINSCNYYTLNLDKIYGCNPYMSPEIIASIGRSKHTNSPKFQYQEPEAISVTDVNKTDVALPASSSSPAANATPKSEKQDQKPVPPTRSELEQMRREAVSKRDEHELAGNAFLVKNQQRLIDMIDKDLASMD